MLNNHLNVVVARLMWYTLFRRSFCTVIDKIKSITNSILFSE